MHSGDYVVDTLFENNYDSNIQDYVPYQITKYIYTTDLQVEQKIIKKWDQNTNSWVNYKKYDYDYLDSLVTRRTSTYYYSDGSYVILRTEYNYDGLARLVNTISYRYNDNTGVFDTTTKVYYKYHENTSLVDTSYTLSFDSQTNQWQPSSAKKYFYSRRSSPVFAYEKENVRFYPNPVTNSLFIHSEDKRITIQIFNLKGQLIYTAEGYGDMKINVISWPEGTYMLLVLDKGKPVFSAPFIKI
jgi:hypothetical protein